MRFSVRWLDVCPGEEKRILRKSAFWSLTSRKSAFCELQNGQSASFGEVRPGSAAKVCFSVSRRRVCPGEEKRILRKSAFWPPPLTEKRSLRDVGAAGHTSP